MDIKFWIGNNSIENLLEVENEAYFDSDPIFE
jgi:hypothetical protein